MPTPDSQLFRDVFNASPIGIAVGDLEGRLLFGNPSFCSFLGFSENELLSKHWVDFSPAEDAVKDWALFQQLRAGSIDRYQLEKRYFRRDGSLVWGRVSISLLKSHPSALVLAMIEDITDAKLAEKSRFRHAAIIESSEDAIISKDLNAIITSWNTGAERIFGYSEAEVVGKPITILIPPELRDEANEILERLRSGGRIEHLETKRVSKTGNKIDVALKIGPIKDTSGTVVGFTKLAHDITQRKQAEDALRELSQTFERQTALLQSREELLKIFVKNVPAGVAMFDRDMRYLQVSDRWCLDYGVDASQMLGRSHYELFPDIPERWKEVHRRALDGETLRADEDRWDRPDGTTWIRWEIRPWRTASGSLGGILIFAENITHRKQMEDAVVDISRRLIQSQEQERSRIGRELHDDINQRLALLAYKLEQLKMSPSEVEARVRTLQEQMAEIADDVQALSHELHSSKLESLGVVGGISSWCKEFGERQGMEIEFKTDVASAIQSEIGVTLFRILQEALHNAVKHSGVSRIEVRLWEQSDEVHLEVRDAGRGFEIGTARQGRGVGLASMDERVRLVRGTIAIESQPNHGTNIHARIPLKPAHITRRAAG